MSHQRILLAFLIKNSLGFGLCMVCSGHDQDSEKKHLIRVC